MTMLDSVWPDDWSPESLIDLVQTGRRITLDPQTAVDELERLKRDLATAIASVRQMKGDQAVTRGALSHLGAVRD